MLTHLKKLFAGEAPADALVENEREIAAAALLVEAALMDGQFDDDERTVVLNLLETHFDLSAEDAMELLSTAEATIDKSHEIYSFARTVKDDFDYDQRVELIEMLWKVVLADGVIDDYESNLIRRLSGLLYISDRDSGEARKRVVAELTL